MSLVEQINHDLKEALKAGEADRLSTLRLIKNSLTAAAKDKSDDLTDEEALKILHKEIKQRRDSVDSYSQGGRKDLVDKEQAEIDLLKNYLPEQMDDEALEKLVSQSIAQTGANSIAELGKVMSAVMAKAKGQADGARVSELVRKRLSS